MDASERMLTTLLGYMVLAIIMGLFLVNALEPENMDALITGMIAFMLFLLGLILFVNRKRIIRSLAGKNRNRL